MGKMILNGKEYAGSGGSSSADNVTYDNQSSGLASTNVQDGIDELNTKFSGIKCMYRGSLTNYGSIEIEGFNTGAYLFFTANTTVRGGFWIYYEPEQGLNRQALPGNNNADIWNFSYVSGNKIRVSLNNKWTQYFVLYKMI